MYKIQKCRFLQSKKNAKLITRVVIIQKKGERREILVIDILPSYGYVIEFIMLHVLTNRLVFRVWCESAYMFIVDVCP